MARRAGGLGVRVPGEALGSTELGDAIEAALRPWREGSSALTVLFSGGLDSGVLAWELRHRAGLSLVTVGLRGAPDLAAARSSASVLALPWAGTVLGDAELERLLAALSHELGGMAPSRAAIFLALAAAVAAAPAGPVLCGQGADELFLGYRHFEGLDPPSAEARAQEDLERLQREDWPRSERIATSLGRELHAPFLNPGVVRAATAVPIALRLPRPEPKAYLRAWSESRGLPPEIARRPKKALQYGSGVDRWLRSRRGVAP
jgi:asparagine synthase (glutamine-hydrolysing)